MTQTASERETGGFPRCPHARECGACQHVNEPYDQQVARKQDRLVALLREAGLLDGAEVLPFRGMDEPYRYRNKVMSPFAAGRRRGGAACKGGFAKDGRGFGKGAARMKGPSREILTGMYAAGTHRIVDTRHCLVENERAQKVVRSVKTLMMRYGIEPYDEDAGTGFMRHVVVRVGHESGEMLVTLVTNSEEFPASRSFCRELARMCPFITTVVQNVNLRKTNVVLGGKEQRLYGPGFILDTLCGLSFRISSQSFYQVNSVQTEALYLSAIGFAQLDGTQSVIDAYCGTGTIGLVAASRGASSVVGVDTVESSIRDARENARHNGIENATFHAADASSFMRDLAAEGRSADVVFMDPPRAGSTEEFLDALAVLSPRRVVYISCNPVTQMRDLRYLAVKGYRVDKVQGVDMFPHTDHVEVIALLSKLDSKNYISVELPMDDMDLTSARCSKK